MFCTLLRLIVFYNISLFILFLRNEVKWNKMKRKITQKQTQSHCRIISNTSFRCCCCCRCCCSACCCSFAMMWALYRNTWRTSERICKYRENDKCGYLSSAPCQNKDDVSTKRMEKSKRRKNCMHVPIQTKSRHALTRMLFPKVIVIIVSFSFFFVYKYIIGSTCTCRIYCVTFQKL